MNRYNQVPHLTQATMGKRQERKHHIQEGQEVSPFPAGDHKAARNRQNSMTNTNPNNKKDPQKITTLERSVRQLLEGLNMFHCTNLTLNSDVDQAT